jgi:AcrR family transcriptional regulator
MATNYHHGDLPAALIEAGQRCLRDVGLAGLSIRELARRAGVSATAPYRHFADRQALLEALAADGFRQAARALAQARPSGAVAVATVWSALARESPGLFQLMASTGSLDAKSELAGAILEWLGEVTRVLDRKGDRDDPEGAIRRAISCWATVHGLVALQSGGAFGAIDDWMVPDAARLAEAVAGD